MSIQHKKAARRAKIVYRIRKKIRGTAQRPRLCVHKSNHAFYALLIDDQQGHTLVAVDTRKEIGSMKERVVKVGEKLAQKATLKKIQKVCFDRAGYPYHGHVKSLSDTVKSHGINH